MVPLKSIKIKSILTQNLAKNTYSFSFTNNLEGNLLNTIFCFPLPANAAFSDFEAKFGTILVKGIVKEKEQAREEFK
jgi:Ca-activated chloride channel family protein